MASWFEFASCITALVISLVQAIGRLVCGPCYDEIETSIKALTSSDSLHGDSKKLGELLNQIKGMDASDEIDKWIKEAEEILQKVVSSSHNDDRLSCCSFGDACSRCQLHKDVLKIIDRGNGIISRANLLPVKVKHICGVPDIEDGSTAERNLNQVMEMLDGDEVWSIGVWGPGGVGKTTLANALNNKLKKNSSFTLVRFFSLTRDADEKEVQKAIAKELGVEVEEGMDTGNTANQIDNRLQREKFLLILDNVWKDIDLVKIGVPRNQKGSNVMLTTRLEDVCTRMEAKAIKIGYLTATEAWQLFVKKAGDVTDPRIRPLAEAVCEECGGLPLALAAVGSAMRGKTNIHQWQSAVNNLKNSIFPDGIESQVYKSLKLSFDFLPSDTLKYCFLYCSLYPEGFYIRESELVHCWLAENIIDENLTYESAYSNGLDLIESLKNSCLLLKGGYVVKLHDVVRDVATRIAKSNGTSIVFSGHGISKSPKIVLPQDVENIRWISFVDNHELALPEYKKDFPKVTTSLIRAKGVQVPEEFLKGFQALRVLNGWSPQSFPHSPLHLTYLRALLLRHCGDDLEELPCGTKLMVLDLSYSSFYKLPRGVEKQANLRVLVLSSTTNIKTIEVDVILNLSALEVLDMEWSGYKWATVRKSDESKEVVLRIFRDSRG